MTQAQVRRELVGLHVHRPMGAPLGDDLAGDHVVNIWFIEVCDDQDGVGCWGVLPRQILCGQAEPQDLPQGAGRVAGVAMVGWSLGL